MHDQIVATRRARQSEAPWLLRNMVLVVAMPVVLATVALTLSDAGDGWWLLTALLASLYYAAVIAAILRRSFNRGERITREDLAD
jgi:putative effector of murein hydrolase LrgA (UPF0299 family)